METGSNSKRNLFPSQSGNRFQTLMKRIICLVMLQIFLFTNIVYSQPSNRSFFRKKQPDYKAIQEQREEALQKRKDALLGKTESKKAISQKDVSHKIELTSLSDLSNIYIPEDLGRIVEVHEALSGDARLIVHIQDLHTNPEAQLNAASILELLIKDYGMNLVCSEGAEGEVDTSSVSSFPDPEVREKTARLFIDSGELTGEEYLSITKYPDLPIWGIENKELYFKNIIDFNKIMRFSENAQTFIQPAKETLEKLKPKIYSKKLLEIDSKYKEYDESKIGTNEYVDYLLALSPMAKEQGEGKFKNIALLTETIQLEKRINQDKVMQGSQELLLDLEAVLKKRKAKEELDTLLAKASLFKDNKISPYLFYSYLDKLARRHLKEEIDKYPQLFEFVEYLTKVNSLDSAKLFHEIDELTYETKDALSTTQKQKLLTESLRHIKFIEDFFNLKISNEELDYYNQDKDSFSVVWFETTISKIQETPNHSLRSGTGQANYIDFNPDLIDMHLPDLEEFYDTARKREVEMVKNAISQIERRNSKVTALVAGGFHTRGITDLLKQKDYSYIVIAPYSSTEIDEENYKLLLSGKRKPLSDLIDQMSEEGKEKK